MKNIVFYFGLILFGSCLLTGAREDKTTGFNRQKYDNPAFLSVVNSAAVGFENSDNVQDKNSEQKQQDQLISALRPRLFVRADDAKLGRGLTLSELRLKLHDPAYKDWTPNVSEGSGRGNMPGAMQYLLTGDKKYALAVGEHLAGTDIPLGEHTSTAAAVYHSAIAFDWVRNALPDEMADKITAKLVEGAEHLKGGVRSPSINHNYSIVSLYGLSMVAIAIHGESDEMTQKSREYMQLINNMLTGDDMLFYAFQQKGGVWGEGNHYTPNVVYYPFLMTLRGLTTATNVDYFRLIRNDYGNFIKPMAKFVIANFRPDFTLERIGDVLGTVVPTGRYIRPLLELLASEIDDVTLQGQVRSFTIEMEQFFPDPLVNRSIGWLMMVLYDKALPEKPSYKTLPLAMRLGKGAYEHIMFRNSWEEDGTLITYISGDQYTHHQHIDKGHFLIYKNGALAVDGGGYGSPMYGDNWANYSTRTLAHNCVLVYDPDEEPWKGTSGTLLYPDGGQQIQVGKQNHKNWKQYMEEKDADGLNTADVLAFDADPQSNRYNYVKTDLTKAYGEKVNWMDRQLMYLPEEDFLVVKDRIVSAKPLNKYWMLHFEEKPIINNKAAQTGITDYEGDSEVRSVRTAKVELGGKTVEYSGALLIKALLPEKRKIIVTGGPGYEYYNRFAGKNFPNSKPFDAVIEPGNWRMETGTVNPELSTVFLHALEITDADKKEMVVTQYIEADNKKMDGVLFLPLNEKSCIVLFNKSADDGKEKMHNVSLPVQYKFNSAAPASHVLAEMEPEKRMKVTVNNKVIGIFSTTQAGILSFEDKDSGERTILIEME